MAKGTVVVTGASGLLGRAVYKALAAGEFEVVGTGFSRVQSPLVKLDITNKSAISQFIDQHAPVAVIHCAAERRPDVAEKNKDGAYAINVTAAGWVAEECKRVGAFFVYISTDYVFDGKNPPYEVDSVPCPINYYGESKLQGEQACIASNPDVIIFRVPILYGNVEFHEESAVNCLVPIIQNTAKRVVMDDFQVRYPTNVDDVAKALTLLTVKALSDKSVKGVYHFCAKERTTKYEMCKVIAESFGGLDISHLEPLRDVPLDALANRPYNAQLSNTRIEEEAGIRIICVPFKAWWKEFAENRMQK